MSCSLSFGHEEPSEDQLCFHDHGFSAELILAATMNKNARPVATAQSSCVPNQPLVIIAPAAGFPTSKPNAPMKLNIPSLVPILSRDGASDTVAGVESDTRDPEKNPYRMQKTMRPDRVRRTAIQQKARTVAQNVHSPMTSIGFVRSASKPGKIRPKIEPALMIVKI